MPDVTVKRIQDFEDYAGQFLYAGKGLGVTAWGMSVLKLPPGWKDFPDHDHADLGQEEVYVVLEGSGTLYADDETWELTPGSFARLGPEQKRRIVPGERGATLLALGGIPGKAFVSSLRS